MGLMGIRPNDTVVIVGDEKMQDATMPAIALARLGHAVTRCSTADQQVTAEKRR